MTKISVIICFVVLISASVHAQPVITGTASMPAGQGSQGANSPGGERRGPPPEAYTACEGKAAGARAQFTNPRGETVTGTCRTAEGRLVLRPDNPPGAAGGARRGPPPEAYKACEGKSSGSTAQLVNPRGETVTGKCEQDYAGKMVLRPDIKK